MSDVAPEERILIYLRVRAGDEILVKSKVRELRALSNLVCDFLVEGIGGLAPEVRASPQSIAVEYVDASDGTVLVRFQADPAERALIISGHIPARARRRMLGAESVIDRESFEKRASDRVGEEAARDLADDLFRPDVDVRELIEKALDAEGNFLVRLPMPGAG